MTHGSKLILGWIAVIQLILSLVFLDALLLNSVAPGEQLATWLQTTNGYWFSVVTFGITGVIALVTWLFILFIPTTTKVLTLKQEHSYRLTIDKAGIEHSLASLVASEYPQLTNVLVRVRLNQRKQTAKVKLSAITTDSEKLDNLEARLNTSLQKNLQETLGVQVKHLSLQLTPYRAGDQIKVT